MSLYAFGKIVPRSGFRYQKFVEEHHLAQLKPVDPEDVAILDCQPQLALDGFYFVLSRSPNDVEATGLWNDAREEILKGATPESTELGSEVAHLLRDSQVAAGGIAFVDGAVERVLEGSAEQCWVRFTEQIVRPWDDTDNVLLVWSAGRRTQT